MIKLTAQLSTYLAGILSVLCIMMMDQPVIMLLIPSTIGLGAISLISFYLLMEKK